MYFVPFVNVDNNYEREPVVYHPSMWSASTPPKTSEAMSDKLVCVTNRIRATGINVLITHADLHEVFSPFGPITSINIIRNKFRNRNGIAFITYFHTIHAQRVLQVTTPIYLKGNRIYTHQAIQKPRHVNYVAKPINRSSAQATLSKNEESKNLLLQEDKDGSIPNPTCSSIDSNTKPLTVQQSTTSSSTNYSSTETSSTIRNDSKSLCAEKCKKLPAISKSFESRIQNSQEFNRRNFHKTLSGVVPVTQGFSNNQTSTNYRTYGINQMTDKLSHPSRVSRNQNSNYSYGSNQYFLPERDVSYNPFYVNNHMYQRGFRSKHNLNASESKTNRFHQFNSTLYNYEPVVYDKSDLSYYDKKQSLASQQMKSQVNVIYESKIKNRSFSKVNTTNVSNKQSITQIATTDNKVDVSLNNDISEELYSPSSYQKYADSFVESARQLAAFEEQFADAPYQFLQPEEDESEPSEYRKIQSRLLRYNLKRNTGDSNDSFISSDSDDGVTVVIEQFQNYGKYFKKSQGDTRNDSTSNQLNLLKTQERVIEQNTFLSKVVSHIDKSENLSNQLNLWETTEAVIEQSTSLNKEVSLLDKSEERKPKVSDEPDDKDTIVEISVKSGYCLFPVRNIGTQIPNYDKKLSKLFTAKMEQPSFSFMKTETCTNINEDEIFYFTSTSITNVKNKKIPRKR